jgi:spermidine synthase
VTRIGTSRAIIARAGLVVLFAATSAATLVSTTRAHSEALIDTSVRAEMLKHRDGSVAHIETEYNDLFILKHGTLLAMSTRYKGEEHVDSAIDLLDPDALPATYTQLLTVGLVYPPEMKRVLMIGMGAGSVSTYIARFMPDVQIDSVELDPGVIAASKKYFGLQESERVRIIQSDGRVFLTRQKDLYDLIILDAYRELGVPFHLLTKEFYDLVRQHLAPGGVVASNITGGTKLYTSTVITFRAAFPTVDVYPDFEDASEAQAIIVAMPAPRPSKDALMEHAAALQSQFRFRYPLLGIVGKRVENHPAKGGELLTDDFAPVNLYETIRIAPRRRR